MDNKQWGKPALLACLLVLAWGLPAGAWVLPPGFTATIVAEDLGRPAGLTFGPDKTLYVTEIGKGQVLALRWQGDPAERVVLADNLAEPLGVAWYQGSLYVTNTGRITRFRLKGLAVAERKDIVTDLPRGGGHNTDSLRIGADGWLYVTQGSSCNVCVEKNPRRAAMLRYHLDGSGGEVFARGLRNSFGFDFQPQTGEIWSVDNGRDWLGDKIPPEELNQLKRGGHYGWPYCYGKRVTDKAFPPPTADFCSRTEPTALDLAPHAGAAGVAFYTGSTFPADYRNNLFVVLSGSWNSSVPTGHELVRVVFKGGRPVRQESFFRHPWRTQMQPVGVAVGPDGALYISDLKFGGRIIRIQYKQ